MVKNKPSHILVIRLSAMGDVAMTVPVLLSLIRTYPNIKITVLTRDFFRPIFENISKVDVFVADVKGKHKGFLGLWRLFKELKPLQVDAVADVHNVLRSNVLKLFFRIQGIPVEQIDKGRSEKKALTAEKKKVFKPLISTHKRYALVFSKLGLPIKIYSTDILPKQTTEEATGDFIGSNDKFCIGIAPFAAFNGKTYPLDLMEEAIKKLNKTNKYKIILFGSSKEKDTLEAWDRSFENCLNMAGRLPFKEELVLMSNLDLMLSMDSGNAHLAAMYGVATVTLWGVTHPYAGFYPFGQDKNNALIADRNTYPLIPTSVYGNKFPKGYDNVMETITPDDVVRKIDEVLLKQV